MKLVTFGLIAAVQIFASVAQAETLSDAMQACSKVDNSLKRLVCYDKLVTRMKGMQDSDLPEFLQSRPRAPVASQGPAEVYTRTPAQRTQEDTFGMENQIAQESKAELNEIVAAVQKVETYGRKRLQLTLDNGQVWRQSTGDTIRVKLGDTVVISRGVLGAFYLRKQGKNKKILVKRAS